MVTIGLVSVGGAALAYQLLVSPATRRGWLMDVGLIPASASPLAFVTSLFVPTDLVAGLAGLLVLWIFGDNVEDRLGRVGFILLFLGGGLAAAAAAVTLVDEARIVLPATAGAIGAIIGAYVRLLPRSRVMVLVPVWRDIDLVDVPAPFIAAGWLFVHVLRHAGVWLAPVPLAATLALPVVGFGIGVIVAQFAGHFARGGGRLS